jgi:hypothetical protein
MVLMIIVTTGTALFISCLLASPDQAYACEVIGQPSVEDAYEKSAVVFSGKVARIQNYTVESFGDWHLVSFEVDRYWKTANENSDYQQAILFTAPDGNYCGYEFEVGKTYLVYTIKWWHDPDQLYTGLGYRNQPIEKAQEDLAFLGEGRAPTNELSWGQQIQMIEIEPLPQPHIEAQNTILTMVGIGTVIAGAVAFFSFKKLRERNSM